MLSLVVLGVESGGARYDLGAAGPGSQAKCQQLAINRIEADCCDCSHIERPDGVFDARECDIPQYAAAIFGT